MLMASICPLLTQSSRKRWKKNSAPCLFIENVHLRYSREDLRHVISMIQSWVGKCVPLRTAPRWINWIRYNLRPVWSQWTISDWEKYGNLTPASIENAHGTWVVALCCQFVLWWFRSFFYVNDCAVMNVQFSPTPLWLAGRICVQLRCRTHAWSAPAAQGILHLSTHSHGCTYSVLPEEFRIELMWLNV